MIKLSSYHAKYFAHYLTRQLPANDIQKAFDVLQTEMQDQISDKMINARATLLENFDESVHEKLRTNFATSRRNISLFEKCLWQLTAYALGKNADCSEANYSFTYHNGHAGAGENPVKALVFDYSGAPKKITLLEELIGMSGRHKTRWMKRKKPTYQL